MGKNTGAIDKIIKTLSHRDYQTALKKFWKTHKRFDRKGNLVQFLGYSLAYNTVEAIEIKHKYQDGKITEEEYKTWCLKWNLVHCQ